MASNPVAKKYRAVLRHAPLVSLVLYVCALVAAFVLPSFVTKGVYLDENAMLPGNARPAFGRDQLALAERLSKRIRSTAGIWNTTDGFLSAFVTTLKSAGLESAVQRSSRASSASAPGGSGGLPPTAVGVGLAQARCGDAKESIALVFAFDSSAGGDSVAAVLGFAAAVAVFFSERQWLSRSILVVAADSAGGGGRTADWYPRLGLSDPGGGGYRAVQDWLDSYSGHRGAREVNGGTIASALVFDVSLLAGFDTLEFGVHGRNGRLPNLDALSLTRQNTVHGWDGYGVAMGVGGGFRLSADTENTPGGPQTLRRLARAASFIWQMASGLPSGAHGAFLDHSVDAISVRGALTGRHALFQHQLAAAKLGGIVETTVRCLSNLIERFHHSVVFYVLIGPDLFIPQLAFLPVAAAFAVATLHLAVAAAAMAEAEGREVWAAAEGTGAAGLLGTKEREGKERGKGELGGGSPESRHGVLGPLLDGEVGGLGAAAAQRGPVATGDWSGAAAAVALTHLGGAVAGFAASRFAAGLAGERQAPAAAAVLTLGVATLCLGLAAAMRGPRTRRAAGQLAALTLIVQGSAGLALALANSAMALIVGVLTVPVCIAAFPRGRFAGVRMAAAGAAGLGWAALWAGALALLAGAEGSPVETLWHSFVPTVALPGTLLSFISLWRLRRLTCGSSAGSGRTTAAAEE